MIADTVNHFDTLASTRSYTVRETSQAIQTLEQLERECPLTAGKEFLTDRARKTKTGVF